MTRNEVTLVMLIVALVALAVFAAGGYELHRIAGELSSALDGIAAGFAS